MSGTIRPVAIGIVRRGSEILVFDAYDSVKAERFHRPLGGGIEFGERAEDALRRELREEIGCEVSATRLLGVLESVFTHEGREWHEIVFVFDVEFEDSIVDDRDELLFTETIDGEPQRIRAIWVDPSASDAPLYPDGLTELLAHPRP